MKNPHQDKIKNLEGYIFLKFFYTTEKFWDGLLVFVQ